MRFQSYNSPREPDPQPSSRHQPWEQDSSSGRFLPPTGEPPRRQNRRGFVVLAIFVVLLLGLSAALVIRQEASLLDGLLGRIQGQYQEIDPGFGQDSGAKDTAERKEIAPTTIRRAPLAPEVSLALAETAGAALSFQEIYEKALPSIVSVDGLEGSGYYQGTGVIMTADGYVITNHHVIAGCSEADVTLHNGRRFSAALVGTDAESDLAILKIETDGLIAAEFGSSELLKVGDVALAVGNPLGSEFFGTMTDGIISAINRDVVVEGYNMTLIQTTAALNPGNSGGALLNTAGQVVGITNMKMMSAYNTIEGLGFAIPTATVKEVADALLDNGVITGRPTIGITCLSLQEGDALYYGRDSGVYVESVTIQGPADAAGLKPGDVILAANGVEISSLEELTQLRDEAGVGGELALTIWRAEETLELTLVLIDQYELYE